MHHEKEGPSAMVRHWRLLRPGRLWGPRNAEERETARKPILSTIWADDDPVWVEKVEVMGYRGGSLLRHILRVAWAARSYESLIVLGSVGLKDRYRDLAIAALVRRLTHRNIRLIVTDCTWSPGSRALGADRGLGQRVVTHVQKVMVLSIRGPQTIFCVLSSEERHRLRRHWPTGVSRVAVTPFCHTLYDVDKLETSRRGYVFAGGDSLRDYQTLVDAVRSTSIPVRIATRLTLADCPPNVLLRPLSHEEYLSEMAGADVVVVPLLDDGYRSSGQQTYLNAMLLAKPTVITDAPGVREMVEDGYDAIVCRATAGALRQTLIRLFFDTPPSSLAALGANARASVLSKYTPDLYRRRLLFLASPSRSDP